MVFDKDVVNLCSFWPRLYLWFVGKPFIYTDFADGTVVHGYSHNGEIYITKVIYV